MSLQVYRDLEKHRNSTWRDVDCKTAPFLQRLHSIFFNITLEVRYSLLTKDLRDMRCPYLAYGHEAENNNLELE